jgi:NAD(P)-dependent dehydrogenase (short-subunit alcohol dehydrogenase family)
MMRAIEQHVNPDDPAAARKLFEDTTALKRYGSPDEVVALVAFLLSDDAGFLTGAAYSVDAGVVAGT